VDSKILLDTLQVFERLVVEPTQSENKRQTDKSILVQYTYHESCLAYSMLQIWLPSRINTYLSITAIRETVIECRRLFATCKISRVKPVDSKKAITVGFARWSCSVVLVIMFLNAKVHKLSIKNSA